MIAMGFGTERNGKQMGKFCWKAAWYIDDSESGPEGYVIRAAKRYGLLSASIILIAMITLLMKNCFPKTSANARVLVKRIFREMLSVIPYMYTHICAFNDGQWCHHQELRANVRRLKLIHESNNEDLHQYVPYMCLKWTVKLTQIIVRCHQGMVVVQNYLQRWNLSRWTKHRTFRTSTSHHQLVDQSWQ